MFRASANYRRHTSKRHNISGHLGAKSREVALSDCGFWPDFQLLIDQVMNKSVGLPQRDFGLAGGGPSTSLKSRANSAREMIASHQGLSTTGNKIIRSHAHQGGRVHRLTPVSLGPAWSSIHTILSQVPISRAGSTGRCNTI